MKKLAAIALGVALAGTATVALAGRNSSGTMTLPSGNPVVTGTGISSTWANNTLGDIASELTNSLDRSGKGGMLAPIRVPNGSASAPTISFTNETNSGWYRAGTGDLRFSVGGTDRCTVTSSGLTLPGTLSAGTLSVSGNSTLTGTLTSGAISAPSIGRTGAALSLSSSNSEIQFLPNGALAAAFQTSGALWMGNHQISAVATPSLSDDAATKGYVDGMGGRIVAAARFTGAGTPTMSSGSVGFASIARIGGEAAGGYLLTLSAVPRNPIVMVTPEFAATVAGQIVGDKVYVRTFPGGQGDIAYVNVAVIQGN